MDPVINSVDRDNVILFRGRVGSELDGAHRCPVCLVNLFAAKLDSIKPLNRSELADPGLAKMGKLDSCFLVSLLSDFYKILSVDHMRVSLNKRAAKRFRQAARLPEPNCAEPRKNYFAMPKLVRIVLRLFASVTAEYAWFVVVYAANEFVTSPVMFVSTEVVCGVNVIADV